MHVTRAPTEYSEEFAEKDPCAVEVALTGMRKTVLFVTRSEAYGGLEKLLMQRLAHLRNRPFRSVVACTLANPFSEHLDASDGVQVLGPASSPKTFWQWFRLFRNVRPDWVVFEHGALICFQWPQYLAARLAGVRRIFAVQHLVPNPVLARRAGNSLADKFLRVFGWRTRHLLPWRFVALLSDRMVCVSDAIRKSLIVHYDFPAHKLVTIPNGVDVSEFAPSQSQRRAVREKWSLTPDDVVIVSTARLAPVKAPDVLLRALAELVQRGLAFKCILAGDGPLREQVQEQIRTLGLSKHVLFVGFQPQVKQFLQAADIFVLTSRLEGMPLALIEALACGLPAVATDVGGNAEVVSDGSEGFIVPSGDVPKIADALSRLIEQPQLRAWMAGNSREKAQRVFDIQVCLKAIEQATFAPDGDDGKDSGRVIPSWNQG